MSECARIAALLAADEELSGLLGPGVHILQGTLSEKPPYPPPLILISANESIPLLENEDGVVAESCRCTIGILAEGGLEALESRTKEVMEEAGYRCEMLKQLPAGRPEWHCCAMSFSGARLRV
jgi:hypothetical protein